MSNPLDYVPAKTPENTILRISPSSFGNFISRPWHWYRTNIQKLDVFTHNTMSVIGTIVHYCAEQVGKGHEVNQDHINEYLDKLEDNENFDREEARSSWYDMAYCLINQYVLPNQSNFLMIEEQICKELEKGYYAAGTIDILEGTKDDCMLTDYKTYNSKTKPKSLKPDYKYQALVYSSILKSKGYNVTRIRNVNINKNIDGEISEKTNKRLKSYPPELTIITEELQQPDLDFIDSMLELCVDSYKASLKHPELRHIIYHDPRIIKGI